MEIQVLASGSKGNCYRVSDGGSALLLEAGLTLREIREGIGFRISGLAGCLVTHEHQDHARAVRDLMRAGVDCYMSAGSAGALGLDGHRLHVIRARVRFAVGPWSVVPFETVHDAAEPLGFLITIGDEKLLYLSDSAYCRYRFVGVTHLMLEVNYHLPLLKANVADGSVPPEVKRRVLRSHMNLTTALDFLKANDLSRLKTIWLIHLSEGNSDERMFKAAVQRLTGVPVYIAGGAS